MLLFLAIIFLFALDASCQSSTQQEVGMRFNNFRDFSLVYKKQLKENKYLRLRSVNTNFAFNTNTTNVQLGVAAGLEKRRAINPKLEVISGPELALFVGYNNSNVGSSASTTARLSYVIGLNYAVKPNVNIGIEMLPNMSLSSSFARGEYIDGSTNVNLSMGWSRAALFAVYSFEGRLRKAKK